MTQVILVQDVEKLGRMGDIVDVKPGYARNYLIPQGLAMRATAQSKAFFEQKKAEIEKQNAEAKAAAAALLAKIDGQVFVAIRQCGEKGQLYGSVSPRDVADLATQAGFTITREQVIIENAIKFVGLHQVRIRLYSGINAYVTVNVARSNDEAAAIAESATRAEQNAAA